VVDDSIELQHDEVVPGLIGWSSCGQ
jgi:hypothetical protein